MADGALVGIDLGTTGVKVGVIALDGRVLAISQAGYPLAHPGPGAVEQDPSDWWGGVVKAMRRALSEGGHPEVEAVTVAGQGPTLVAVDDAGEPVRPAICWMDTRSANHQTELAQRLGRDGFLLGNLPKIAWMEQFEPEAAARATWFLSSWDYVTMRLCGRAITSIPPNGSQATPDTAAAAGLDADRIPEPVPWATVVGEVTEASSNELGMPAGARVVTGANDALVSYAGAGLTEAGQAVNNGGTSGGFAVYWSDDTVIPGVYSTPAIVADLRLFGGAMSATGLSLDWFRRIAGAGESLEDLVAEAAATPAGAAGLVFLPYLAGERSPLWDRDARGTFVGLGVSHTRGHMTRAVLEAAGHAIRHVAEPILDAGVEVREMRACGGAARSDVWNQIKADVTGFRVAVPETVDTVVVGAGILGSVGLGHRPDLVDAMRAMVRIRREYEPKPEALARSEELYQVYRSLYPALRPAFGALAAYRERFEG